MLKITVNHKKQDITYSYTMGQTFPTVEGKLLQVELSGKELARLLQEKEIPICSVDTVILVWHGRAAGRILNTLREILQ